MKKKWINEKKERIKKKKELKKRNEEKERIKKIRIKKRKKNERMRENKLLFRKTYWEHDNVSKIKNKKI